MRVLDLSRTVAGGYCGSMLALAGAEVSHCDIESDTLPAPLDDRLVLDYVHRGTATLPVVAPAQIANLVREYDALIEDWGPGILEQLTGGEPQLRESAPSLVITRVSEFGQTGPWANWTGSELVNLAAGGMLFLTGQWDRPPVQLAPYQAQLTAGLLAAIATMAALLGGGPLTIDLSKQEAVLALVNPAPSEYLYSGTITARDGRVAAMPRIERASDRWVYVGPGAALTADYKRYAECVGIPEFAEERFAGPEGRMANWEEHQRLLQARLLERTADEWVAAGAAHHLTFGHVQSTTDLLNDPVLAERGYLAETNLDSHTATVPLAPYLLDGVRPATLADPQASTT